MNESTQCYTTRSLSDRCFRGPVTVSLRNQNSSKESDVLKTSVGTARNGFGNLDVNSSTCTQFHYLSSVSRGSHVSLDLPSASLWIACVLIHCRDGWKTLDMKTVIIRLEAVSFDAYLMLHHLCLHLRELEVYLAGEVVVSTFGNVEPVVRLVEFHASVHKGVSPVIPAAPVGLVACNVGLCKEEDKYFNCRATGVILPATFLLLHHELLLWTICGLH